MEWAQFLGIIITLFGLIGFLYKEMKEWRSEVRTEISSIRQEINSIRHEMNEHSKRSDRLYEMFIDLLKSQPRTNP